MRLPTTALALLFGASCAAPASRAPAVADEPPAEPSRASPAAIEFFHDDVPAARARALAEGKALFVDAWAPWCHTCLSMHSYVLTDPALGRLAERVVFAAIDTDRPENAAFLERHAVVAWPTLFVLDPATDEVLGYWPESASVAELVAMIEEALERFDQLRSGRVDPRDDAASLLAAGRSALAARRHGAAALAFSRAAALEAPGSPRRSQALVGWTLAFYRARDWEACAALGTRHAAEIRGTSAPVSHASYVLTCASKLPEGPLRDRARAAAIDAARRHAASPPRDATQDDQAEAHAVLAEGLLATGDAEKARAAQIARLSILEQAARAAPTPGAAATFDYGRASAYLALGRGDEAVAMLLEREKQLPSSYEPPARLASVLARLGRDREALAALERALPRAYGPRKLGYLKLRAEILGRLGDRKGQLDALREEVRGHEALARGHAHAERLADARRRLAEVEGGGGAGAP